MSVVEGPIASAIDGNLGRSFTSSDVRRESVVAGDTRPVSACGGACAGTVDRYGGGGPSGCCLLEFVYATGFMIAAVDIVGAAVYPFVKFSLNTGGV